jgi:hypothetical protein
MFDRNGRVLNRCLTICNYIFMCVDVTFNFRLQVSYLKEEKACLKEKETQADTDKESRKV